MYPASFVEWLKDECDVRFDSSNGQYAWQLVHDYYTTDEVFEYWKSLKT